MYKGIKLLWVNQERIMEADRWALLREMLKMYGSARVVYERICQ